MVRPKHCRRVSSPPACRLFKPAGQRGCPSAELVLSLDEFEALRLADLEGLYQEQAAERMQISRQTFGRIVQSARHKVAKALAEGRSLRIEGGTVEMSDMRIFECAECGYVWGVPFGTARPSCCPSCQSTNLHRSKGHGTGESSGGGRGHRRRNRFGHGRGGRGGGQQRQRVGTVTANEPVEVADAGDD